MNASAILTPTGDRNGAPIEQLFDDIGYEVGRGVRCVPGEEDRAVPIEAELYFLEILGTRQFEEMERAIRKTAASEGF